VDYLGLKAFHIAAASVWIGGLLIAAVTIGALMASRNAAEAPGRSAILDAVRSWDRRVTTPAMVLVWAFGMTLAIHGDWFGARWLTGKLVLVLALSALHGLLSGSLRRLGRADATPPSSRLRHAPAAIIVGVVAIVLLVVIKPL
jgi:uncharacterized membrane protein